MKTKICKICKKNYSNLADDICFHCDIKHWFVYWNKQY